VKRGDIVTVALSGDYGKPRPAVVIQSDWVDGTDSVLVCLFTSTLRDAPIFRLTVEPLPANGLKTVSQVMVDNPSCHLDRGNPSGFAHVGEYPYSTTLSEEPRWTCKLYSFIACVMIS